MIVDFHTHIFPDKIAQSTISALQAKSSSIAQTDGTVDGLLQHMQKAGVSLSVTLPVLTKPTQFDSVVKFAILVNERFANSESKLISFAGIHPACDNIPEKMRLIKNSEFKGVKIHPDYQSTFIDDEGYLQILKSAKDNDLIVVTHAGVDNAYIGQPVKCPPQLCEKVIKTVNHDKFILGHFGGHLQWQEVFECIAGKNVYLDTAYTLHEIDSSLFKKILSKHGEDKVLFATDCPWCNMNEYIKIINSFNLDKETQDKIFYKNALKLLNMENLL